ncbi:MAG TPA: four helix bundle protein [Candidatus Dojkabacteria bacterium]
MRKNVLKEKSFEFSLLVIKVYKELVHKKEFVISKQLLRSATSIGANIVEAQQGVSKKVTFTIAKNYSTYLNEVISLLTKIISTSKKSLRN